MIRRLGVTTLAAFMPILPLANTALGSALAYVVGAQGALNLSLSISAIDPTRILSAVRASITVIPNLSLPNLTNALSVSVGAKLSALVALAATIRIPIDIITGCLGVSVNAFSYEGPSSQAASEIGSQVNAEVIPGQAYAIVIVTQSAAAWSVVKTVFAL